MKTHYLMLVFALLIGFTACDDDKNSVPQVTVHISLSAPDSVQNAVISNVTATLKNITTGKESTVVAAPNNVRATTTFDFTVTIDEGLYNITVEGDIAYTFQDKEWTSRVRGYKGNVQLTGNSGSTTPTVALEGFLYTDNTTTGGDFVIAEIFFTGTETPEGKQYTGDKYFRIFNNSSDTLYADRLMIAESQFQTVKKYDYTPDITANALAVQAVYVVPGNGKDYPVAPGKSILICDNAIDHTKANTNSFDLTKADFEWYDESSNPNFTDVNNPDVPDMDKYYCYTATIWGPHNRGFHAYALARLGENETKTSYLKNYAHAYTYNMVIGGNTYPMSDDGYKIPNSWILDAVNCSIKSEFVWLVTSPSLDLGWTYCGTVDKDASRYGKSVRRKVESITEDGRVILKDTNNSSVDFDAEVKADPYYVFK